MQSRQNWLRTASLVLSLIVWLLATWGWLLNTIVFLKGELLEAYLLCIPIAWILSGVGFVLCLLTRKKTPKGVSYWIAFIFNGIFFIVPIIVATFVILILSLFGLDQSIT